MPCATPSEKDQESTCLPDKIGQSVSVQGRYVQQLTDSKFFGGWVTTELQKGTHPVRRSQGLHSALCNILQISVLVVRIPEVLLHGDGQKPRFKGTRYRHVPRSELTPNTSHVVCTSTAVL
jgi:hypothetical protein